MVASNSKRSREVEWRDIESVVSTKDDEIPSCGQSMKRTRLKGQFRPRFSTELIIEVGHQSIDDDDANLWLSN